MVWERGGSKDLVAVRIIVNSFRTGWDPAVGTMIERAPMPVSVKLSQLRAPVKDCGNFRGAIEKEVFLLL